MISPFDREKKVHDSLLSFIKKNPKGLTTTDIARATKISRKTLEKHLQILTFENEIYMKQFGVTKVYYPNHRIHHFDFEKLSYNNRIIWFDILENEYGKYLLIQKKKKTKEDWEHEHSITIPLEQTKEFLKVLQKILNSQRIKKIS